MGGDIFHKMWHGENFTMIDSNTGMSNKHRLVAKCGRCGKAAIIQDISSSEKFCGYCGTVVEQKITGLNNDNYDFVNDNRHVGSPQSLAFHDFGLSTIIGKTNKDAKGNSLHSTVNNTIRRIRIQDRRSQTNKNTDTNLRIAFDTLERIQDKIQVSNAIKEQAAYIYRKANEQKMTQGRSIQAMATASMYAACRSTHTLRTLRDMSEATNIKRRTIAQSYRAIVKQLNLKIMVVDQTHCILKIANNLELPANLKQISLEMIRQAESIGILAGRDPVGMSAAAIYYACITRHEPFTQVQIAKAAGITVVTLRNRFHELQKKLKIQD